MSCLKIKLNAGGCLDAVAATSCSCQLLGFKGTKKKKGGVQMEFAIIVLWPTGGVLKINSRQVVVIKLTAL